MKRLWTATVVATLLSCNSAFSPAFAQAGGMSSTMPGIAATSPFGMTPRHPVANRRDGHGGVDRRR